MAKKKQPGRPPLTETRDEQIRVTLTKREKKKILANAKKANMLPAVYLRELGLAGWNQGSKK